MIGDLPEDKPAMPAVPDMGVMGGMGNYDVIENPISQNNFSKPSQMRGFFYDNKLNIILDICALSELKE